MLEVILNHKTIRNYKSDPIPENILNQILKAGIRASNTGNMQVYSIIVTQDKEIKKQLCSLHFNQKMVEDAPVILTFCADIRRFSHWCRLREAEPAYDNFLWFMNAAIDATIAAQNCCIAAESFGLGICYLGTTTYNADKIIELLKIPYGVVPITSIVIGYPADNPPLTDRLPDEAVIHKETYHDYNDETIEKLYAEKENSETTKELLKINNLPNLAKIFTEKRYTKKDNVFFSEKYINVLKKQGFLQ